MSVGRLGVVLFNGRKSKLIPLSVGYGMTMSFKDSFSSQMLYLRAD